MLELWPTCSLLGNGVTRVNGKVGWPAAIVGSDLLRFRLAAGKTIEAGPAKNVSTDNLITVDSRQGYCIAADPKRRLIYMGLIGNELLNWW